MTIYVFRVWLQPNPLLGFEPDEEVWRDIEINGSHTLAAFHEAIFDAFKRWDSTPTSSSHATRRVSHSELRPPTPLRRRVSWPPMDDGKSAASSTGLCRTMPRPRPKSDSETFRGTPTEGNAADTTVEELDPEQLGALSYTFDMGTVGNTPSTFRKPVRDRWMVAPLSSTNRGEAPPQYRDLDDDQ